MKKIITFKNNKKEWINESVLSFALFWQNLLRGLLSST